VGDTCFAIISDLVSIRPGQYMLSLAQDCIPVHPWWAECKDWRTTIRHFPSHSDKR